MNICSFVPGATEILAALGTAPDLVGISHECDYPPTVRHVPVMVRPRIDSDRLTSSEIDSAVGQLRSTGAALYDLDEARLLAARPDVIIAQELCDVCAVTPTQLHRVIALLSPPPRLVSLSPHSLEDVLQDVVTIGRAVDRETQAHRLAADLRRRIAAVSQAIAGQAARPRVACLEWMAPLYAAGHWVPEMVAAAGGLDVLAAPGEPSHTITWAQLEAADPDVIILMPCGFTIARTTTELPALTDRPSWNGLRAVQRGQVYLVDALSFFSRPGPRLVDGIELLAGLLHPECTTPPPTSKAERLEPLTHRSQ